jgi:hypothetical protein
MAHAWNGTGHMTIAKIAYDHLKPAVRVRVNNLLLQQRDYGLWMSEMPAGDTDKALFAFEKAATWPDDIRGTPDSRPTWHYVDIPIIAPDDTPDPAALTVPTPNAITQITAETALLTTPGVSESDRATALCWVEHLIGDIHQPLHASTYFSPMFPHGDKGGNAENLEEGAVANDPVEEEANPHKLHAVWDDMLGNSHDPAVITKLAQGLETPAYAPKTFPQLTRDTTPASWAQESNALARKYVYLNGTLPITESQGDFGEEALATLPPGYLTQAHAVADRQIALAGLRLANSLNTTFGK